MAGKQAHQVDPRSRNSPLTFAVVWDPERGLEAYSGRDLLCHRPCAEDYETFPESIYSHIDDERQLFYDADKPFNRPGRLNAHFVDPRSTRAQGRRSCLSNDKFSMQSSSNSSYTTASSFSTSRTESAAKSLGPQSTSTTPSSKWTFAALWDPEAGLMAFSRGKLAKLLPSTKHRWLSISTSAGPSPTSDRHSRGDIDNIKRGFYLRVLPELGSHSTASSSTFEGRRHKPHFSCFDPLNEGFLFEPHLHTFPQPDRRPSPTTNQGNHQYEVAPMDTEYVMNGYDFSDITGDLHLPSRFSTSTTSTSAYVPIHPTSVHVRPPITFLGARSGASQTPKKSKRSRLMRSRSPGGCHKGEVLRVLPRLFKNAPWAKNSEQDKWVFVEVQSVVTDRVVDGL